MRPDISGMPSPALAKWHRDRTKRIEELLNAHRKTEGGNKRGRRRTTEQLNWALILRLAAEFQGFAWELHGDAARRFAAHAAPGNRRLESILRTNIERGARLSTGNVHSDALAHDFKRIGLQLWSKLEQVDARNSERRVKLDKLNLARNAIAHDNREKFAQLRNDGYTLGLADAKRWRSALNVLAGDMDRVVDEQLRVVFREPTLV